MAQTQTQYGNYLLYHDSIDAHVLGPSGVVEHVDPAESKTQHHAPKVLFSTTEVEHRGGQEKHCLEKTGIRVGVQKTRSWLLELGVNAVSMFHHLKHLFLF